VRACFNDVALIAQPALHTQEPRATIIAFWGWAARPQRRPLA